jgi:hypothetical protein
MAAMYQQRGVPVGMLGNTPSAQTPGVVAPKPVEAEALPPAIGIFLNAFNSF